MTSHLSWTDLDVEVIALVGDLEDFGPGEAVDAESVSIDEESRRTHAQHDLHPLRILAHHWIREVPIIITHSRTNKCQ